MLAGIVLLAAAGAKILQLLGDVQLPATIGAVTAQVTLVVLESAFGAWHVSPWWTLALDLALAAALARDVARSDTRIVAQATVMGRLAPGLLYLLVIGGAAAAWPLVDPTTTLADDGALGPEKTVLLQPEAWLGKPLPLAPHLAPGRLQAAITLTPSSQDGNVLPACLLPVSALVVQDIFALPQTIQFDLRGTGRDSQTVAIHSRGRRQFSIVGVRGQGNGLSAEVHRSHMAQSNCSSHGPRLTPLVRPWIGCSIWMSSTSRAGLTSWKSPSALSPTHCRASTRNAAMTAPPQCRLSLLLLAGLGALHVSSSLDAPACRADDQAELQKVLAQWQKLREQVPSVRYVTRIKRFDPKDIFSPGDPPEDRVYLEDRSYVFDFRGNRVRRRMELDVTLEDNRTVRARRYFLFDGKTCTQWDPPAENPHMSRYHVELQKKVLPPEVASQSACALSREIPSRIICMSDSV